eukprot:921843-Amorphochlora_amoeboformis.AAC.1
MSVPKDCVTCRAVEAVVEHIGRHHQAQLRVLVRLGAVEVVAVNHGDRVFASEFQALELFQICDLYFLCLYRAHKYSPTQNNTTGPVRTT